MMPRRAVRAGLALCLVAAALAAACGSSASPSPATQVAVGLVTSIDASSPTDVRSFTLRTDDGAAMTFTIGSGTNTGFPPGHLQEHRASGEKVKVTYHVDGSRNVVDGLGDAEAPSGSPGAS